MSNFPWVRCGLRFSVCRIFVRYHITTTSIKHKMPSALVLLAEGAEEMETVIVVDVLRRGGSGTNNTKAPKWTVEFPQNNEVHVILAGVGGNKPVKCSRDVTIVPDTSLEEALAKGPYDAIVCPGGSGGAKILGQSPVVGKALQDQESRGGIVAAVCAAPTALAAHGIGKGKKVTSYPGMGDKMKQGGYRYLEDRVVQDGKLITSRGPGTCFEFALKLVEALVGREKAHSLIEPMLIKI